VSTIPLLPYARHELSEDDIQSVIAVLRNGPLTQGPTVRRFEMALEASTGAPFAVAVSSGTAALHVAYEALGLAPGDEIITSPLTFVATANAARQLGADVVFADVDAEGNLDPESVLTRISPRTKGVVAVHFAGLPANLTALHDLCRSHGLFLVEDAAHALGAEYNNAKIGNSGLSDLTTFSFHPVKHITTGEGGAVLGSRPELKERLLRLREHGLLRKPAADSEGLYGYEQSELGYNYRLSDVHAALGVSQLARLDEFVAHRRRLATQYRTELARHDGDWLTLPSQPEGRTSSYHLFPVRIDFSQLGMTRGQFMLALRERGIGTQVHYIPVCDQPYYAEARGGAGCTRARQYFAEELSLPMFAAMASAEVTRVVRAMEEVVSSRRLQAAV
jgi:perosamine synthetase